MSNTRNTANNKVSSNSIIITKDFTLCVTDFQLLNKDIGIMIVVNKTKYIDIPSTPK